MDTHKNGWSVRWQWSNRSYWNFLSLMPNTNSSITKIYFFLKSTCARYWTSNLITLPKNKIWKLSTFQIKYRIRGFTVKEQKDAKAAMNKKIEALFSTLDRNRQALSTYILSFEIYQNVDIGNFENFISIKEKLMKQPNFQITKSWLVMTENILM